MLSETLFIIPTHKLLKVWNNFVSSQFGIGHCPSWEVTLLRDQPVPHLIEDTRNRCQACDGQQAVPDSQHWWSSCHSHLELLDC